MKPRFFHDLRLSEHFIATDFLQSPSLYNARLKLNLADLSHTHLRGGVELATLLEGMMTTHGPVSLSAGFVPRLALGRGHPPDSPHGWTDGKAAADVVFHDWVNKGKAPISILNEFGSHSFHRVISYAGSEYLCVTAEKSSGYHRHAVIEGVRRPGAKPLRVRWCDGYHGYREISEFPHRHDWRREEHEVPGNSPELRTHHVRVGEYFTLLDFCRSPYAYEAGRPWVIPPGHEPQTTYARQAAEILSPFVKKHGRISVIRGLMPAHLAEREDDPSLWTWRDGVAAVEFMTGEGVNPTDVVDSLTHNSIEQITAYELVAGASYRVEWSPFRPRKIWSSAVQPVSRAASRRLGLS